MNERLVAIKQPVPARKQVSFEPAFTLMLAQHLHHLAIAREELIALERPRLPLPVRDFKNDVQPVGKGLVRTEYPEIPVFTVETGDIAEKFSEHVRVGGLNRSG